MVNMTSGNLMVFRKSEPSYSMIIQFITNTWVWNIDKEIRNLWFIEKSLGHLAVTKNDPSVTNQTMTFNSQRSKNSHFFRMMDGNWLSPSPNTKSLKHVKHSGNVTFLPELTLKVPGLFIT